MRAVSAERLPARIARASDSLLDFVVLGLAAWTAIYHVFVVAGIGVVAATAAFLVALVPCVWLAFSVRDEIAETEAPRSRESNPWARRRAGLLLAGFVAMAAATAAVFAFPDVSWTAVWPLLMITATAALALGIARASGRLVLPFQEATPFEEAPGWLELLVAFAWAVALATLSLFLVRPAADDAYYARLSSWIAAHGDFPTRDVLFSDNVFPAVIYPPIPSFEALVGTASYVTSVAVPNVLYLGVTPLASALSVLAVWRLVRRWAAPMAGVALSVALVFLLYAAQSRWTLGNLFIGRIWEGKVVFLAILVPLLFVFLTDHVESPSKRGVLMLGAAGAAAVGLSTSALFLVPVIAAGCLAPIAFRDWRRAALGFAAVSAYPIGALAVRTLLGGRRAAEDTAANVMSNELAHFVLGVGTLAFLAVMAMFLGPMTVRRLAAAPMTAGVVALVVFLYAPRLPRLVFEVTGIGRVLWRLNWAVPVAVLLGVVATTILAGARPRALRLLPAAAIVAVLVVAGSALWSAVPVADRPSWKFPKNTIRPARAIVSAARPGDVVLAPRLLSQTVSIMSGEVTTVAPRLFYARALEGTPAAHAKERTLLAAFSEEGLGAEVAHEPGRIVDAQSVRAALQAIGVDIACVARNPDAEALLETAGYVPFMTRANLVCLRMPG